jgi:hypothetical protein
VTSNISEADVVYVENGLDSRSYFNDLVPGIKVITVYILCENFEITEFSHQFINIVDVSLCSSDDIIAPNYQHTPCWILPSIDRDPDIHFNSLH